MTKHAPEIFTTKELTDRIWDHEAIDEFPDLLDSNGESVPGTEGKFWRVQWPDHCVTTQHLGDATIHGPFDSEAEAN